MTEEIKKEDSAQATQESQVSSASVQTEIKPEATPAIAEVKQEVKPVAASVQTEIKPEAQNQVKV